LAIEDWEDADPTGNHRDACEGKCGYTGATANPEAPMALHRTHLSRREALGVAAAATLFPGTALGAPARDAKLPTGVVVLDNCDPEFRGREKYEDHLSFFDTAAKLRERVTGLNICEEIGSPHRVAVDPLRKRVWVIETVGQRLLQYDLDGRVLVAKPGVTGFAAAVDPATGNLWVVCSKGAIGTGWVEVFDGKGESQAVHDLRGYDIAYDPQEPAFWLCERQLLKVSPAGKVLARTDVAEWCAVSVAVDPKTRTTWVAAREYDATKGRNELLVFDRDGKPLRTIALGEKVPFRIAVDPRDGSVWVANLRKSLLHYSADCKLKGEHDVAALTVDVDRRTEHVWAVTAEEVLKLNPKGEVVARAKHPANTTQAWIACY
jgi:DNA-binding beta-propeller fold protein YncE